VQIKQGSTCNPQIITNHRLTTDQPTRCKPTQDHAASLQHQVKALQLENAELQAEVQQHARRASGASIGSLAAAVAAQQQQAAAGAGECFGGPGRWAGLLLLLQCDCLCVGVGCHIWQEVGTQAVQKQQYNQSGRANQ